jgi:hypothetical protein
VDLLKDRYVRLSTFQKISQEDQDTIIKEANRIDQKIESAETTLFPTYHKYMEIIISEQKILLDEVNSFIDNMQIQKKEETDH